MKFQGQLPDELGALVDGNAIPVQRIGFDLGIAVFFTKDADFRAGPSCPPGLSI